MSSSKEPLAPIFSIVVPVYQNELNLEDTIPELLQLQSDIGDLSLELVLVDDGSSDRSWELMQKWHRQAPQQIRLVKLVKNFGQIAAIQAGLQFARGNCVGIISADLQDPPELFLEMIQHWKEGWPLVVAERKNREEGILHRSISGLYWRLVNRYAVKGFPIGGFDFCLLDRKVVDEINKIKEKNSMIFVLIFSLGFPHKRVHFTRRIRKAGKSQWSLTKKIKLFVDTFISFSYVPLRLISALGLTTAVLSFMVAFFFIYRRLVHEHPVPGWTSLVVLTSFFGGMILLTLGIIGEYLWRVLEEVRRRPLYLVDQIIENPPQHD
ncbi:MAG: glycosyltransferase family 2 protein [bacterium]|nr:glycosyltransferase family 2 protein [bacterium]